MLLGVQGRKGEVREGHSLSCLTAFRPYSDWRRVYHSDRTSAARTIVSTWMAFVQRAD